MELPHHLTHPQGGGWPLADAVTLWGWLRYGLTIGTQETRESKRLHWAARADVGACAVFKHPPPPPAIPPWLLAHRERRQGSTLDVYVSPPRPDWVTCQAMAELCGRFGISPPWEDLEPPAPVQTPDPLPGSGPIARRKRLDCILAALREFDPTLSLAAMPGTKEDLLGLCQAVDTSPKQFSISLRTFDNGIAGWLQFAGRQPGKTPFYRDSLATVRRKLA